MERADHRTRVARGDATCPRRVRRRWLNFRCWRSGARCEPPWRVGEPRLALRVAWWCDVLREGLDARHAIQGGWSAPAPVDRPPFLPEVDTGDRWPVGE